MSATLAETDAIRRGDPDTIDQLLRAALPGLLRAARAAGLAPDRAEDAVQESVLVFLARLADFDGRARASTWLHGILIRKIAEARRSVRRDDAREDIDDVMENRFTPGGSWAQPPRGPMEQLAGSEVDRMLSACLETVPERQRLAFVLRDVEGFATDELCNILEVSANNLGVLLFRARNRLRECLETKGLRGSVDAQL